MENILQGNLHIRLQMHTSFLVSVAADTHCHVITWMPTVHYTWTTCFMNAVLTWYQYI